MAKGPDVGTTNILSVGQDGSETVFVQQHSSFIKIDYSDMVEQVLSRSDVLHIRRDDRVYITGNDTLDFANIFGKRTRRPMQHGTFSSEELFMISMIKLIIERVIGSSSRPNERLSYSSPADPIDSDLPTLCHDKALGSMLDDMSYDFELISKGMVVTYSGLADNNFTGLGISFDTGMMNICLAYHAVPVMQFSIARGGDWTDQQTARAVRTAVDKATLIKEDDSQFDFRTGVDDVEGALSIYYENLFDYIIENIERETDGGDIEEGPDVPVIVTGGISSPEGFEESFKHRLEDSTIPLSANKVRSIDRPLYGVTCRLFVAACFKEGSGGSASDPELEAEAMPESN